MTPTGSSRTDHMSNITLDSKVGLIGTIVQCEYNDYRVKRHITS